MNSRLIVILALITVLGLLGAVLLLQDESPEAGGGSTVDRAERVERPGTVLPEPVERPVTGALPTASQDRTAQPIPGSQTSPTQITGRVLLQGGIPVASAQVACFQTGGSTGWMQYSPTGQTVATDEDGRFRLVGVPERESLSLEVTHATASPTTVEPLQLEQGQVLELGDIVLEVGVRLFGKVLDPEGRPVVGAHLLVSDMGRATASGSAPQPTVFAETLTDGLGEYSVEHLGRRQYTVDIDAEGFAKQ